MRCLLLLSASGSLMLAAPAHAQSADTPSVVRGAAIEEVIVTATKRSENIQDVPVSVTALTAKTLERANVTSVDDIQKLVPSFYYYSNSSPRTGAASIRGITTRTTLDGEESSVATVVDGVVLGRQAMSFMDLYDLEQIEVLAGPQGTLFGKNSSAGVLSITTKGPSDQFEATGKALYGNRNEVQLEGSVAGPLMDGLTGRMTGYYHSADGELDAVNLKKDLNNINNFGLRAKLRLEDGDSDFTLAADFGKEDVRCCGYSTVADGAAVNPALRNLLAASGIVATNDNRKVGFGFLPTAKTTNGGVSLTSHWKQFGHDITSITAWRQYETTSTNDSDGQLTVTSNQFLSSKSHQFSQELRAANSIGTAFDYTLGVFYFNIKIDDDFKFVYPTRTPEGFQRVVEPLSTENYAVFGDLRYHFPDDKTQLRVGARYTWETNSLGVNKTSNYVATYTVFDSQSTKEWSGVVALQHNWTDDVMTYASASRGFKGAAYNQPGVQDGVLSELKTSRVRPEIATNFELGVKSSWFDNSLMLNLTVFNELFSDYQSTTFDAGNLRFQLLNVGAVRTRGAEFQYSWAATESLKFSGSVDYTNAYYSSFKNGQCGLTNFQAGNCSLVNGVYQVDLTGQRLFHAPMWRSTFSAEYNLNNVPGPFDYYFQGTYAYRSSVASDASVDPLLFMDGYGTIDARIGAISKDGRYEIAVFGKNLTDENIYASRLFAPGYGGQSTGVPAISVLWGRSRSYGVQLIARL